MVHWNSPELPWHKPNESREEIMKSLIYKSNARVNAGGHNAMLNVTGIRDIRPTLEAITSRGIFLIQTGIGTFPTAPYFMPTYLVFDIASDYTWTQCEGCNPCFHQRGPLFPWQSSTTFVAQPCTVCPTGVCQPDHCTFDIPYGIGGHIRGFLATETFVFPSHSFVRLPNMEFNCIISTQGFKVTATGNAGDVESGVFSLSRRGYENLMRNIRLPRINNYPPFSYCLPPIDEAIQHPLFLRFGRDIPRLPLGYQTIKILDGPPGSSFYYLDLHFITVGKTTTLDINPLLFKVHPDGDGGCYIDTVIAMSYLPRFAYDPLVQVLARQYEENNRGLVKRVNPSPIVNLPFCYKQLTETIPTSPEIAFHFPKAAFIVVDRPMGGYTYGPNRFHCLQILPNEIGLVTIIGAMQQVNHRFVFDLKKSVLKFASLDCASSK